MKYRFKVYKITITEWEDVTEFIGEYYTEASNSDKAWSNIQYKHHFRPHGNVKYRGVYKEII